MSNQYCIIGAGAAGLAALKTMTDAGFDVDCFEKSANIGGHWNTDYDALHLITPKSSSCFDGFPMPADYPVYPSRDQVKAYMNDYTDTFGLREKITFNTEVRSLTPVGGNGEAGWQVTLLDGTIKHYAGVLVANGHLWDCKVPEVGKGFTGVSIHSGEYRNVQQVKGKVLVVGFGNSGCDLAVDAAQARLDTTIVIRRGQLFQPKTIFGVPRGELPLLGQLPPEQQNMVMNMLIMATVGTHKNYPGMPAPETYDLDAQPPVVNTLLLYWIQHGRIKVAPGIENIEGKTVTFTDGSQGDYDTIVWATGFHTRLPFLDENLLQWRDGAPLRTAAMTLPTNLEGLFYIGLGAPRGPQWPVYCDQTKLVIRFLKLRAGGMKGLASKFAKLQPAESRIDIVKRQWLANYQDTQSQLDVMELALQPSTSIPEMA
jgi:cation diffusion facilitator CzcD-associated flavoprotein CzcO